MPAVRGDLVMRNNGGQARAEFLHRFFKGHQGAARYSFCWRGCALDSE